jgi:energy-coupling factor transporter transmembrane protein EcfT
MTTRIFDRDTILDLTVNFIPLAIILFFVVGFVVVNPFGWDPLASSLQFALLVTPFVLLAILTYLSGKAISLAEKEREVYMPGQATVEGAEPLEEHGAEAALEGDATN